MANRNSYRNFTPEQVATVNGQTWERMQINGVFVKNLVDSTTGKALPVVRLTFEKAAERLGLRLVQADIVYSLDAEGKVINDEKGNPVEESRTLPVHDIAIVVKEVGHTDHYGTAIPKGKQYFVADKQPANRPVNDGNVTDLGKRLNRWGLTGEPLIKDANGSGQNEQHRCWAVVKDTLTGAHLAPPEGIPVITIDGVAVEFAGAIDTGKQKTATDDLGSDPNILPNPLTLRDYKNNSTEGYGPEAKQARVKILRDMQGVCKRITLRMLGKNVKASLFSGYESGGNVMAIAEQWGGLDDIVNVAYAYVMNIPLKSGETKQKQRPVKVWEIATAYALWLLRDSTPLQSEEALPDYDFPVVDITPLQDFLTELEEGAMNYDGALADWCRDRVTPTAQKQSDESQFAQVLVAMREYFNGREVSPDFIKADRSGKLKENGAKFTHMGGGDRGPIPKKVKSEE